MPVPAERILNKFWEGDYSPSPDSTPFSRPNFIMRLCIWMYPQKKTLATLSSLKYAKFYQIRVRVRKFLLTSKVVAARVNGVWGETYDTLLEMFSFNFWLTTSFETRRSEDRAELEFRSTCKWSYNFSASIARLHRSQTLNLICELRQFIMILCSCTCAVFARSIHHNHVLLPFYSCHLLRFKRFFYIFQTFLNRKRYICSIYKH